MSTSRLWRGTAVLAAACGLTAAGAGTAVAASPAAVTVTITTRSGLPKVTGDTLVVFRSPKQTATVSGTVTGAAGGDIATLLARPFGATGYSPAGQVTLRPGSGSTAPYSFRVRPRLAASYEVQVSGTGISSPVTSAARTVYVEASGTITGKKSCSRPVCHLRLRVWVEVPPPAYRAEAAKHWYLYSRLRLAPSHTPALPRILDLNRSATASRPRQQHPYQFVVTLRYAFRIGSHDAYRWRVDFCTRDTEAADGLGLPGHHGCGNKRINATSAYLG